jgi:pimeloyl-ACP methyl ester carboxylesterase
MMSYNGWCRRRGYPSAAAISDDAPMAQTKSVSVAVLAILMLLIVLLGTMRLGWWNPSYEAVKSRQATPPSEFVTVGKVQLHVRDEGQGPVLIMLHSSMTNLREWDAWADRLKPHYRVIRLDWPPYGLSTDPAASRGMSGVIDLLDLFVAQRGVPRFTLIGSSSGATIAVLYAAKHPEKVNALALSTLPLAAPPPTQFSTWQNLMQWVHDKLVPNYFPRFYYESTLAQLYGVPSRLQDTTVDWYYETNNLPGGFKRVREYYEANRKAVWSKGAAREAASIKVPVLLQWGDRDPVLAAPLADTARAQFSSARVTLIHYPDVGHYPMLELPEQTGHDLATFLGTLAANAAAASP